MVQSAIEANFTCQCGKPLIIQTIERAPKEKIMALVRCPKHRTSHQITLDHSALDYWAGIVADHLYRCTRCGKELAPVADGLSSEHAMTFTLSCPFHATNLNTRTVWNVIYNRLLTEIQTRRGIRLEPQPTSPTPTPSEISATGGPGSQPAHQQPKDSSVVQFCPQCGKRIRPNDNFCYHCGTSTD